MIGVVAHFSLVDYNVLCLVSHAARGRESERERAR